MSNAAKTRAGLLFILVLFSLLVFSSFRQSSMAVKHVSAVSAQHSHSSASLRQASQSLPSGTYAIMGKPSIPEVLIDHILCSASSPACGTGSVLYRLGVQYGIDPVFPLAFFQHESRFGRLGIAATNLSLGNIRCAGVLPTCRGGYRAYATWSQGYQDWYRLLKYGYVEGHVSSRCPCITIGQIIPVYAPQSDHNDERAYIAAVEIAVATWRHQSFK